jgi:hypothetical protein
MRNCQLNFHPGRWSEGQSQSQRQRQGVSGAPARASAKNKEEARLIREQAEQVVAEITQLAMTHLALRVSVGREPDGGIRLMRILNDLQQENHPTPKASVTIAVNARAATTEMEAKKPRHKNAISIPPMPKPTTTIGKVDDSFKSKSFIRESRLAPQGPEKAVSSATNLQKTNSEFSKPKITPAAPNSVKMEARHRRIPHADAGVADRPLAVSNSAPDTVGRAPRGQAFLSTRPDQCSSCTSCFNPCLTTWRRR